MFGIGAFNKRRDLNEYQDKFPLLSQNLLPFGEKQALLNEGSHSCNLGDTECYDLNIKCFNAEPINLVWERNGKGEERNYSLFAPKSSANT